MKYIYPKLLALCLAIAVYCNNRSVSNYQQKDKVKDNCVLTVKRGAFHFDSFEVTKNKIRYSPTTSSKIEHHNYKETFLDTLSTLGFFKKVEAGGFWNLSEKYSSTSSCKSELKVTLTINKRSKTVICEDYENNCPELIKYIDKKVVELEGNRLDRVFVPG